MVNPIPGLFIALAVSHGLVTVSKLSKGPVNKSEGVLFDKHKWPPAPDARAQSPSIDLACASGNRVRESKGLPSLLSVASICNTIHEL